ncbi:hypothetical protein M9458_033579, partial [Cirrhinus mrigala]
MMLNMKMQLSLKKRRTGSSSTVASGSEMEDRVVMLCEDIPSEGSLDSGRGSHSPGAHSSGDSQTRYSPDWSSVSYLPERDLRRIHEGSRMDDISMVADAKYLTRECYAVPSSVHGTVITG